MRVRRTAVANGEAGPNSMEKFCLQNFILKSDIAESNLKKDACRNNQFSDYYLREKLCKSMDDKREEGWRRGVSILWKVASRGTNDIMSVVNQG